MSEVPSLESFRSFIVSNQNTATESDAKKGQLREEKEKEAALQEEEKERAVVWTLSTGLPAYVGSLKLDFVPLVECADDLNSDGVVFHDRAIS